MKGKVVTTAAAINAALAKAKDRDEEPLAVSARYWPNLKCFEVVLTNSERELIPRERIQGLTSATRDQLKNVKVEMLGTSLSWPDLDVDLYVPNLLKGVYGTARWMSELGRQGGRVKSPAKSEAARLNGQRGGRPRKSQVK